MAGRFVNPLPQFSDSTPTMYAGAKLFFYAAGTSTKQNTYTTKALTTPNANPIILNAAGRIPTDIFLQDLEYKVVLAPATDTDPPTSPIWTADPVSHRDSSIVAKTVTGSGSPNGSVAGTAGSASILPDFYWDYTNSILYVCTATGTSSTAIWTAINASASAPAIPPPQGRLTLSSATPVLVSDVVSATTVYYTPYVGSLIPIYNGSTMVPSEFSELSLSLVASHALNTIYDVFVFSNSGVLTVVTGPAWSNSAAASGARGTGAGTTQLTRVKGLWVNAVSMTARNGSTTYSVGANLATYVGSIFMDGVAGQITCHTTWGSSRKWGVWNAYNRVAIVMKAGDASTWSYTTNTTRAARGQTTNSLTVFQGLPDEFYDLATTAYVGGSLSVNQSARGQIGIGYNSTTAFSGKTGIVSVTNSNANAHVANHAIDARYQAPPAIGINVITALENGLGADVASWSGTEAFMVLSARYQG